MRKEPGERTPPPVEVTFQLMQSRKIMRRIWGTYESDRAWTMMWVFLTLLLVFGVAGASFANGDFSFKLSTGQLGFWSLVTVLSFSILVYTLTRVIVVFRWMLYWLLSAEVLNLMLHREYNLFSHKTPSWLAIGLVVVELLTLMIYLFVHFMYPRVLASDWFRERIGAQNWWEVRMIGPWTLTYASGWNQRNTCTYRGETNAQGLPHGYGHWMDDSYHGEILTGWWENGRPVGPFRSREFGSGYAFDNLMIGYVCATDDEFGSFKLWPSNNKEPRCGVASVECSVSGGFFSHLPAAKTLFGQFRLSNESELDEAATRTSRQEIVFNTVTSQETSTSTFASLPCATMSDCLARIKYLTAAHPLSNVVISANDGRGVSVAGHVFDDAQNSASKRIQRLVIDVVYPADGQETVQGGGQVSLPGEQLESNNSGTTGATSRSTTDPPSRLKATNSMSSLDSMLRQGHRTPALRSSMQFAEGDLGDQLVSFLDDDDDDDDDTNESEDNAEGREWERALEDDDADDAGSFMLEREEWDVDSVEYDSASFELGSFGIGGGHQRRSNADHSQSDPQLRSHLLERKYGPSVARARSSSSFDDKERILMDPRKVSMRGSIPLGFKEATGHVQPMLSTSVMPHLRVQNWKSAMDGHAEALIFIPGFNCSVRGSLERLGQFLAMGHFPPHIKPFVFSWPAGQVATYLWALAKAADERTADTFGNMLDGLAEAGIRDVHILTHSMGVQALMGMFRDTSAGDRSAVSRRFALAKDFEESRFASNGSIDVEAGLHASASSSPGEQLLRLRTVTLLNPDYPLAAFVDRGFATIRRVCDHVTVVGNRKDGALFWSETGNGLMQNLDFYAGVKCYPEHVVALDRERATCSKPRDADSCCPTWCTCCCPHPGGTEGGLSQGQDRLFSKQLVVGKSIFSLFAPAAERQNLVNHNNKSMFFGMRGSILQRMRRSGRRRRRRVEHRPWLDLDAIDTTWMEANVHALRHSYFNLNPVLVEDLHELIVTGRRASERSTLLHREGNIYSYCQAPACVVNED